MEFELTVRGDTLTELKHSAGCRKASGTRVPPLLLTPSPKVAGADGAAGEKRELGFILAGKGGAEHSWIGWGQQSLLPRPPGAQMLVGTAQRCWLYPKLSPPFSVGVVTSWSERDSPEIERSGADL